MAHVSQKKKDNVKEFTELIDKYPIIGIVDMQNLPTRQLQVMRENLRGKVLLRMTKKRLAKLAFANSKKEGVEKLVDLFKGMPALLFTEDNPFALFSILKKNKSKAPINAGQTAPNDITVPAKKTNFAPGPVIGELGAYGIKTAIEDAKIVIKEDKVVAKEGDVVDAKLAGLLQRLGVEPMEIGLDLVGVFENGEIIPKSVLDIDEDAYKANFETAATEAFNLAFNAGFPTEETITLMVQKAAADAKALAIEADILTDETVGIVLSKAEAQAKELESSLDIKELPQETSTEAAPEEKKAEESADGTNETETPEGGSQ